MADDRQDEILALQAIYEDSLELIEGTTHRLIAKAGKFMVEYSLVMC